MSDDLQADTRPVASVHFEHWWEKRHPIDEIEPPADDQPDGSLAA